MKAKVERAYPIAIFIRGLPGSGKSYLTDALKKSLGGQAVVLDPDAVDQKSDEYLQFVEAQVREGVDPKLHLYRWSRAKAYAAIEAHKIIVWNQAFTNLEIFRKMIDRLETHAAGCHTKLPILVVEVEADYKLIRHRVTERASRGGHNVTDEAFAKFIADYKSFADEGFNTVRVHGEADINQSVAIILDALDNLKK